MLASHQTTRRVEFRDTDAAGIVHFSVFFTWMEQAEHELLRSLGLSVVTHDAEGTLTWPRVSTRCDFLRSVRFEQLVEIDVRVKRVGDKSVTYAVEFTGPEGVVAQGEITSVCCRLNADGTLKSCSIPDEFRRQLTGDGGTC